MNNKKRRAKARRALAEYLETRGGPFDTAIIDLLTDLRHFCDTPGIEFSLDELNRIAANHYAQEQ